MTVLILSPAYSSHYRPLATIGTALASRGRRVVVATGEALREQVLADSFEWRPLQLGRGSNAGISRAREQPVEEAEHLRAFFAATRQGAIETLLLQAERRGDDLLWEPERSTHELAGIVRELSPSHILSDQIAYSATLALRALELPFTTFVPGHPSQLPVAAELYGFPPRWPAELQPPSDALHRLEQRCREVSERFGARFTAALAALNPRARSAPDAFREHGSRVLYGYPRQLHDPGRLPAMGFPHRFVGPCTRDEHLPAELVEELDDAGDAPLVYLSLGTFLSQRTDVIASLAHALEPLGVRAAIAIGDADPDELGTLPRRFVVRSTLPQVALLQRSALCVSHAGNNSVGEALSAGVPLLALPFSTDQFAIAADLARGGVARVLDPGALVAERVRDLVMALIEGPERDAAATLGRSLRAARGPELAADALA